VEREKEEEKILTTLLTLALSRRVEREKEQNFLKAPLTFILSRKGREESKKEFNRIPLTLPSPAEWRGRKRSKRV
jgi:hypothetical protein